MDKRITAEINIGRMKYLYFQIYLHLEVKYTEYWEGKKKKKNSGSGTGSTQPREYNWGATW
jgi:hypothetical protein